MVNLALPQHEPVYRTVDQLVIFNQLAVKIEMDAVSNDDYFGWLDTTAARISTQVHGAQIAEKPGAREAPPLNVAVYYDTPGRDILPTGSLLRTSCNRITHAFCAFKLANDTHNVRRDHRYVFDGDRKRTIQADPTSDESVAIVASLLARTDIEHPGTHLRRHYGIDPTSLIPTIGLDDLRYTFFAWLDGRDALRCSIDRAMVYDLRPDGDRRRRVPVSEVEIAVYPRIAADVAADPRLVALIDVLSRSLRERFDVALTTQIKYQRATAALGL